MKTTFTITDLKPLHHLTKEWKIYAVNHVNEILASKYTGTVNVTTVQ